jgi:hypothetical protein
MCEMCKVSGLARDCSVCGGFDWAADVYEDAAVLRDRLCVECRGVWVASGYDREAV